MLALLALGFGLAFVNGANDVSKGIATLVGSGVAGYQRAIIWGTGWTAAGALAGAVLGKAMLAAFGSGLLAPDAEPSFAAAAATLVGAAAWVLLATRVGLPVSTTHAIVGSLVGVTAFAYGADNVQWSALTGKIALPLLMSPLVSLLFVLLFLRGGTKGSGHAGHAETNCMCAELTPAIGVGASSILSARAMEVSVTTGTMEQCEKQHPAALRLGVDHLHWLTSGATSFARGLNDAPKIVALVLAAATIRSADATNHAPLLFGLVALGMVAGSIASGRRVTQVMAENLTPMDHQEGFIANVITASLVATGATLGWPMSTTHVASGCIVGAGISRSSLNVKVLRDIALAWLVTLPAAAALGITAYGIARAFWG